jgi:hypothetical protein
MIKGLELLKERGAINPDIEDLDSIIENYEFQPNTGYAIAFVREDALIDKSKLGDAQAAELSDYETFVDPSMIVNQEDELSKTFSAASIKDEMRLVKYNPKVRLRYIVLDFKRYWNANKNKLLKDPKQADYLAQMFQLRIMGLFEEVVPFIEEGKQLATLIGISQVTPKLTKVSRELSLIYRKAMKAEKTQGMIPRNYYSKLKTSYAQFMTGLLEAVMPEYVELARKANEEVKKEKQQKVQTTTKAASRSYSRTVDGRIKLFD